MNFPDNPAQHQPIANVRQHLPSLRGSCIGQHPTAQYKVDLLQHYVNSGWDRLCETGLYNGHGSGMNVKGLTSYVVIDFQEANCEIARQNNPYAIVICGDSAVELPKLLTPGAWYNKGLLFWLDAHGIPEDEGFPQFPLFTEIMAIADFAPRSVVLIDDLCMMPGMLGSPPLDVIERFIDDLGIWDRTNRDCIMRLEPIKSDI